jgi:peptidoglycan hydrolase CwlO-like protein
MAVMLDRWNDDKMDALAGGVADLGHRVDMLDVKVEVLDGKVDDLGERVDRRFEEVDKRFEQVDRRFEQVDKDLREQRQETKAGFDGLNDQFRRMQLTLIGVAGAIVASLIAAPHL